MAASALLLLLVALAVYIVRRSRAKARLPPGPPADPLIGHLRVWPTKSAVDKLYEWSKQYGDVMHFDLLGKSVVVLSSREAVSDLLDKRGVIYSNRPFFPAFELLGWTDLLLFQQYGPDFHKQRKMAQQPFTRQGCLNFRHIQIGQTRTLLKSLLNSPEEFEASLRRFTSAITLEIIYGHKVDSVDDEFTKIAERATNTHIEISKAGILELFPSLRHLPSWFPGAWFIRFAQENQDVKEDLSGKPFEQVRRQLAEGKAQPSFVSMHLEELAREGNDTPEELRLVKLAAWQIWTAGEETTWATLMTIILAAVMNPDVVKKAQAEIDRVVGTGRLPTFEDEDSLPYVQAFIWEARRWHTVVPLGVPHLVKVDDIYRDMLIPKDTSIFINMKALALQESVHKDPHKFWPERYLPGNDEPPPTDFVFGFGRRVCPGRFLADASIWLVTATLLAAFDILPVQDKNGKDMFPSCEYVDALTSHPAPFECRIKPRSKQAEALVAQL